MTIVFFFPNYERLAKNLVAKNNFELGSLTFKHFPEQESYIKLNSSVKNKEVILICGLENADQKIMALMFFSKTTKDLGATKIKLIAPYLGYMRMDKRFNDGEAITSNIFAEFLSAQVDELITIDPHLHRHKTLEEIYSIPCKTLHAFDPIAAWIADNVKNPILIGPDSESEQWVSKIAQKSDAPFVVLEKIRHGDKEVEVSFPQIEKYLNHTPILIDDIIATARTMIETVTHLKKLKTNPPICIGVHAIFAGDAFLELQKSGAGKIVTCNTIKHSSNLIDVDYLMIEAASNEK
jgi:ribose-phosphate pyrophosphokinase